MLTVTLPIEEQKALISTVGELADEVGRAQHQALRLRELLAKALDELDEAHSEGGRYHVTFCAHCQAAPVPLHDAPKCLRCELKEVAP